MVNVTNYFTSLGGTSRKGSSHTYAPPAPPLPASSAPTIKNNTLAIGTDASTAVEKQLELQRRASEVNILQENIAKSKRIDIAKQTAELSKQALAIQQQERQNNLGKEMSALNRSSRQAMARTLANASGAGITGSSAYRASATATRSNLTREQGYLQSANALQGQADTIKQKEIDVNLQTAIANNAPSAIVGMDNVNGAVTVKGGSSELLSAFQSQITSQQKTDAQAQAERQAAVDAENKAARDRRNAIQQQNLISLMR